MWLKVKGVEIIMDFVIGLENNKKKEIIVNIIELNFVFNLMKLEFVNRYVMYCELKIII